MLIGVGVPAQRMYEVFGDQGVVVQAFNGAAEAGP